MRPHVKQLSGSMRSHAKQLASKRCAASEVRMCAHARTYLCVLAPAHAQESAASAPLRSNERVPLHAW